jgi:hypothetical protein
MNTQSTSKKYVAKFQNNSVNGSSHTSKTIPGGRRKVNSNTDRFGSILDLEIANIRIKNTCPSFEGIGWMVLVIFAKQPREGGGRLIFRLIDSGQLWA